MIISSLTKIYGSKVLFEDVSLHIPDGHRIALFGVNGAGKTTLLNILCGREHADHGDVTFVGQVRIGYLPQEPNPNPESTVLAECLHGAERLGELTRTLDAVVRAMETDASEENLKRYERAESAYVQAGGYGFAARVEAVLQGLGFHQEQFSADPKSLSGGYRMRVELAKLLCDEPDWLILDEPTNHLDLPSLAWMERYLESYTGSLLFVSHDRSLLERLPTHILHLHTGKLDLYPGKFSQFLEQRDERLSVAAATRSKLQGQKESYQRFIDRFGAKASKATQAQSRAKMIERLSSMERDLETPDVVHRIGFQLKAARASGRVVLKSEKMEIGYAAASLPGGATARRSLLRDLDLTVERGQKIAIIGANGLGKSTLLKTIAGVTPVLGGTWSFGYEVSTAYCAQDQTDQMDLDATVLEHVMRNSTVGQAEARSILGLFLFSGEDAFKPARVLSGGERNRLALACALAQRTNLLLLDEPTNHLDISSTEALATALHGFNGTILFVSHNREFIDSVCTHILVFAYPGIAQLFEGNLDDYRRLALQAGFPYVLADNPSKPAAMSSNAGSRSAASGATPSASESRKDAPARPPRAAQPDRKLLRRQEEVERQIEELRGRLGEIDTRLESLSASGGAASVSDIGQLGAERDDVSRRLEEFEEEWLRNAESIEDGASPK